MSLLPCPQLRVKHLPKLKLQFAVIASDRKFGGTFRSVYPLAYVVYLHSFERFLRFTTDIDGYCRCLADCLPLSCRCNRFLTIMRLSYSEFMTVFVQIASFIWLRVSARSSTLILNKILMAVQSRWWRNLCATTCENHYENLMANTYIQDLIWKRLNLKNNFQNYLK